MGCLERRTEGDDSSNIQSIEKPDQNDYPNEKECAAATAIWTKKNSTALGLIQGTSYGITSVIWTALETRFGKAGGAQTYLQVVNMITIKMTNSENLLSQVQEFQENYTHIHSNGHSKFSEDLIMFTFCSKL